MKPADRALAREALLRQKLTIEQVESIRADSDTSGRPFGEIAVARGLLTEADVESLAGARPRIPPVYLAMLGASLLIFAGLLIATLLYLRERFSREDRTADIMAETERKTAQTRRDYDRRLMEERETRARASLEKARASLTRAEERLRTAPAEQDLLFHLNEAAHGFNAYVEIIADDAPVLVERARVHELRRNYDKAIEDLDRAVSLRPDLEPGVREKRAKMRSLLPPK